MSTYLIGLSLTKIPSLWLLLASGVLAVLGK